MEKSRSQPGNLQPGNRLVFVGGSPRSGTTLLQSMLDSHPDICGGPEFDLVPDIVGLRNRLRASVASGRISVYGSDKDVDREVALFIERLLLPYAGSRDCQVLSEKTPWNVLAFKDLLEVFPAARFIFCVRDPRAVTASMLQVRQRAREKGLLSPASTKNTAAIIKTIETTNRTGFEAAGLSNRVLTVPYEQLVVDPEKETKRICDFLVMPWSEEMVRPGEKKHDGEKVLDGVWHYPEMYNSNPDSRRLNRWQDQLTPAQKVMVAGAFGDDEDLIKLGYRFPEELSVAQQVAGKVNFGLLYAADAGFSLMLEAVRRVPALKRLGKSLLNRTESAERSV